MKIIHITFLGEVTAGQMKQLAYEKNSTERAQIAWQQKVYTCRRNLFNREAMLVPSFLNTIILRGAYLYFVVLRSYTKYDIILLRYLPFNPFMPLLLWSFRKKIVLVYHGKMIDRLKTIKGKKGQIAAAFESALQKTYPREIRGIVGVTDEVAAYESKAFKNTPNTFTYPNGTLCEDYLDKNVNNTDIQLVFLSGEFSRWQGLDRLIDWVSTSKIEFKVIIHIIGRTTPTDQENIRALNQNYVRFQLHGYLKTNQYQEIIDASVAGIAPLAIDRIGVVESCSLKVREYLNNGLYVLTNHYDHATNTQDYAIDLRTTNFDNAIELLKNRKLTKSEVFQTSRRFVDKQMLVRELHSQLITAYT